MRSLCITAPLTITAWILASIAAATPASAQAVIVLVPDAAGIDASTLERARAGAIEVIAERGIRLVRTPDGPECEEASCAAALATRAGADGTALVALEATQVRVIFVPAMGDAHEATRAIGDAGVSAATAGALEEVLDALPSVQLGFVRVRTDPPGVAVELDGRPVGRSPLRQTATLGEHSVRLLPEGRAAITREVVVRPGAEAAVDVEIAHAEGGDDGGESPAPRGPTRTEPSAWNWLIGGGLALGGIIALISPLQTLAQEGECLEQIEDVGCVERVRFGAQSGVLLGVGLAALVAAVVVDAVAPIREQVTVDVEVDDTHGAIRVGGRF